jgi:hypothetical protein
MQARDWLSIPIAFHVLWNGRLLRIAPFILIALALGLLSGCASTTLEVYPPVGAEPLGPDEGLLILHIETEVPLASISLPWALAVSDLPKGRHLWIVRARAGTYRWKKLHLAREVGSEGYLNLDDYRVMRRVKNWVWDDEFRFDVEAGQINYPGHLIIRSNDVSRSAGSGYSVRNRNHAAMAIRQLLESHPEVLRRYSIRYGGSGEDEFLEYYTRVRDEGRELVGGTVE